MTENETLELEGGEVPVLALEESGCGDQIWIPVFVSLRLLAEVTRYCDRRQLGEGACLTMLLESVIEDFSESPDEWIKARRHQDKPIGA